MLGLTAPQGPVEIVMADDATSDEGAPSRLALLQRAAELGPGPRLSLDNIMLAPTDPILAQKRQPGVIERRARFRKVVKVALGLCAGFCLFATAATAFSSSASAKTTADSTNTASVHGNVPASVVVPKEPLEVNTATKADKPAPVAIVTTRRSRGRR
jgi:hypothetical protein